MELNEGDIIWYWEQGGYLTSDTVYIVYSSCVVLESRVKIDIPDCYRSRSAAIRIMEDYLETLLEDDSSV